jgi:DNA-binding GntR family transcriptional regulator
MLVLRSVRDLDRTAELTSSARRLNPRSKGIGAAIKQEMAKERDNQRFHQGIFENTDFTFADDLLDITLVDPRRARVIYRYFALQRWTQGSPREHRLLLAARKAHS